MIYKVLRQHTIDERLFEIENPDGKKKWVDLFTDGAFEPPVGVDGTAESWRNWLKETFEGKTMEIESLTPYIYFTSGNQVILD